MTRKKAMSSPAPDGWRPEVGEYVFVPAIEGTIANLCATGKVQIICGQYARVRVGGLLVGGRSIPFAISALRPVRQKSRAAKRAEPL